MDANIDFDENHFIYTGIDCFFEEGGIQKWNINQEVSFYFKERIQFDDEVYDKVKENDFRVYRTYSGLELLDLGLSYSDTENSSYIEEETILSTYKDFKMKLSDATEILG